LVLKSYVLHNWRGFGLNVLIPACEKQQCSDVRDKIFGLLGVCSDFSGLRPNYEKSAAEIYFDLVLLSEKGPARLDCEAVQKAFQLTDEELESTYKALSKIDAQLRDLFGRSEAIRDMMSRARNARASTHGCTRCGRTMPHKCDVWYTPFIPGPRAVRDILNYSSENPPDGKSQIKPHRPGLPA